MARRPEQVPRRPAPRVPCCPTTVRRARRPVQVTADGPGAARDVDWTGETLWCRPRPGQMRSRRSVSGLFACSSMRRGHGVETVTGDRSPSSAGSGSSSSSGSSGGAEGCGGESPGDGAATRPGISVGFDSMAEPVTDESTGAPVTTGALLGRAGFMDGGFCPVPLDDGGVAVREGETERPGPGIRSSWSAGLECEGSTSPAEVCCIEHLVTVVATAAAARATSVSFTADCIRALRREADLSNVIDGY